MRNKIGAKAADVCFGGCGLAGPVAEAIKEGPKPGVVNERIQKNLADRGESRL